MKFREFTATPTAIRQARAIGLYGETARRLSRAAKRSAQFLDFVLIVQGDEVTWIDRLDAQAA